MLPFQLSLSRSTEIATSLSLQGERKGTQQCLSLERIKSRSLREEAKVNEISKWWKRNWDKVSKHFFKSSKELMVLPKGFLPASYFAQGLRITEDLCYSHTWCLWVNGFVFFCSLHVLTCVFLIVHIQKSNLKKKKSNLKRTLRCKIKHCS